MCGITGIVSFPDAPPPDPVRLRAMCETLAHRGPDEDGMAIRGRVGLAIRRLSIIDLEGGSQPIASEDGSVRVVQNGEIYNFRELRRDLEARGHVFSTHSDTEVIVHAYEEHGLEFPRYLNGMFAIALLDEKRRRFVLVRDPIGIKPLYYAITRTHLVFGSELKSLLASGLVERSLDVDALGEFMAWEYVPGGATLLRGVSKLEPGRLLTLALDRPEPRFIHYWDVAGTPEDHDTSEEEWTERVDTKLRECVGRQLVADVPLGAFLSGGVDSSLVVATMGDAHAFSIGFGDPTYDELPYARRVSQQLGVDLRDAIVEPDVVDLFPKLMHHLDDPIGDFSIFPTYLVSRLAREKVKVVLSGDGGDELFGGYETYLADAWARTYRRIPSLLRRSAIEPAVRSLRPRPAKKGFVNKAIRFVEGLDHEEALRHARWRIFAGETVRRRLLTPDAERAFERPIGAHVLQLFEAAGTREELNRSLYVDLRSYLCDNILVKVDRMSMAASLEARVPYLDTEMVDLAFRIPASLKVARGQTKRLLKRVAARYLPDACVYRPKQGFSIPIKNWLAVELRPVMEDLLSETRLASQEILCSSEVRRLREEHVAGRANHSHLLWSLMVFQAWRERWLDAGG
jgi:asparagine synthase (glutamine-hydrolysing)